MLVDQQPGYGRQIYATRRRRRQACNAHGAVKSPILADCKSMPLLLLSSPSPIAHATSTCACWKHASSSYLPASASPRPHACARSARTRSISIVSARSSRDTTCDETYRSILAGLRPTALECNPVPLVLETLRSDETLDARGLGVRLGALLLRLHLTADDELADLQTALRQHFVVLRLSHCRHADRWLAKRR